ncbi:MAG: hypothetical protein E3J71_09645 [Candidatus Stahlbacteria bacterium]|nr:MAG: hypothetical protein E3J71_09645 [Candidatus Stahlbacteria bacterium]
MRIERILLKNYRQFKDMEIPFTKKTDNDLHIIIGKNGAGKTNILNAINWCLYNKEPHLSKSSKRLPLLNLMTIQETSQVGSHKVIVEVWTRTESGSRIKFKRLARYRVHEEGGEPMLQDTNFEVEISGGKEGTDFQKNEKAKPYVERFVPEGIREFYFFDGDRLDVYFKEVTEQRIQHEIFKISQIDLLDIVSRGIEKTLKDIRNEAGKMNPVIDKKREELEEKEDRLAEAEQKIETCEKEISRANVKVKELGEKLEELPDVEVLQNRREELKKRKEKKKNLRATKLQEKKDLLLEYSKIIRLWPAIKTTLEVIDEERKKKTIPPRIAKEVLEEILQNNTCTICGNTLDAAAKNHVRDLLKKIKVRSDVAYELTKMETPLRESKDELKGFEEKLIKVTHELVGYEEDLDAIEREINKIDKQMSGFDDVSKIKIRGWSEDLRKFEALENEEREKLGSLKAEKKRLLSEVNQLKGDLDTELRKETKAVKLKKQIDFCARALEIANKTKTMVMTGTRDRVEEATKKLFFRLLWKKETYGDVKIHENYELEVIHSMGYSCLGSLGAGERQLLAISFTLALHQVSGFDSAILIDTPVARLSDEHRENFGKIFSEVSTDKQTILLFTPDEYSEDISKHLDVKASTRYLLKLSEDEKETQLVVL